MADAGTANKIVGAGTTGSLTAVQSLNLVSTNTTCYKPYNKSMNLTARLVISEACADVCCRPPKRRRATVDSFVATPANGEMMNNERCISAKESKIRRKQAAKEDLIPGIIELTTTSFSRTDIITKIFPPLQDHVVTTIIGRHNFAKFLAAYSNEKINLPTNGVSVSSKNRTKATADNVAIGVAKLLAPKNSDRFYQALRNKTGPLQTTSCKEINHKRIPLLLR
jgi:hypothetical protein